jgi:hypothetical protein
LFIFAVMSRYSIDSFWNILQDQVQVYLIFLKVYIPQQFSHWKKSGSWSPTNTYLQHSIIIANDINHEYHNNFGKPMIKTLTHVREAGCDLQTSEQCLSQLPVFLDRHFWKKTPKRQASFSQTLWQDVIFKWHLH